MINEKLRCGNFTSSEIVALTKEGKIKGTWGKPALTYIEETNYERKLGRSIDKEENAKPLTWGKLVEPRVFNLLGLEYILTSNATVRHPQIEYWAGSKDGIKHDPGRTIIDIKAPITLKSFCQLVDPLYKGLDGLEAINYIRENHPDGEKYYWQLVSNACIEDAKYGELIPYMPYKSELEEIRASAYNMPGEFLGKCYWIINSTDSELPYLLDEGYYKNLNIIRFEIPQSDKDLLTEKVKRAGEMLIPYPGDSVPPTTKPVNINNIVLQKIPA